MSSTPPRIWFDLPLHADALDLLRAHVQLSGPGTDSGAAHFAFEAADGAILGSRFPADATAFARAPRLKVVARTGIGYDNIDVPAATAAGVCAINTPDAPTESTAEFAIALMFAVARRVTVADRDAKAGEWKIDSSVLGFDLAGKTLALVGFGRIARRVTEIARAVRMQVLAIDPYLPDDVFAAAGVVRVADLSELLRRAWILSLHAPLTPATRRLIGPRELALLPPASILINTARGPLIDADAVLAALDRGHLAGAGMDVWEHEPTPPDHPLRRHPRVVATPHLAAYTDEGRRRSHVAAAQLVLQSLAGEQPPTLLNPEVWPRRRQ